MRKASKISIAALLTAAMLCTGACGQSSARDTAQTTAATATEAAVTTTTETTVDDDIENPVDMAEFVDETADKLEDPNLTYLGYYDMRTAGDIKPAVKLFEETYGGTIDYLQCSWAERIEKLQVLISSGDSPDLVDKESETFPLLISKNVYEDLTDYIDLSLPQWQGMEELIEQHAWNGKHCYYPWFATALTDYVFYSRARLSEYGITTPKELYDSGEWDWNSFRDTMIKFVDSSDTDAVGVYGNLTTTFIATTGKPVIGIENGKITNNMRSPEIDRAMTFLGDIARQGLTAKREGMWGNEVEPLVNGQACFLVYGQYQLDSFMKKYADIEVEFVPVPRDPSADKYYYASSTFGYLVPAGSKNIKGAAAFINMIRLCSTDPDLREEVKQSEMKKKKWTSDQIDYMSEFENIGNYSIVSDFSTGFDSDTATLISDMLIDGAFFPDSEKGSWTVQLESNINTIDTAIAVLNGE